MPLRYSFQSQRGQPPRHVALDMLRKTDDTGSNWLELNRASWDARVPVHLASSFYDIDGFRAGRDTLDPFQVAEVGEVAGRRLVHLQCAGRLLGVCSFSTASDQF
jgi:hypothetical protein